MKTQDKLGELAVPWVFTFSGGPLHYLIEEARVLKTAKRLVSSYNY